ncbi:amidohydrolase family protein [Luteimonas lutimaris]
MKTTRENSTALLAAALLLLAVACAQPAGAAGDALLIRGATVFDGTANAPFDADVLVEDGRIAAVGPALEAPAGATVVDASGQALLPGLFDVHTHWTPNGVPATLPEIANAYIAAGVTTVNDFHQAPEAYAPRRAWLADIATPDVRFAARISTPLGHGADWADQATTRWVNSPESARAAVDGVAAYEPDFIKAFTDGWRYSNAADNTSMDEATLTALVQEAHAKGLEVLTHTVTLERGKQAARAGVDVIAHSLQDAPVDQELIDLMREHGTRYAPTLAVYEPVKLAGKPPADPADKAFVQRTRNFANALANVRTLHEAGIPVMLGTDAGMPGTPHGAATVHELELLVQAGLSPADALRAGTSASAAALGLDDRGTIAPGKRADLLLVSGKPWETIGDIHHVERVYVAGRQVAGAGTQLPPGNARTALPAQRIDALVDDFENAAGRTALDTLRTDEADGGNDRSTQVTEVIAREGEGHALSMQAWLSHKEHARAGALFPLSRGAVAPVDLRGYRGLRMDIRGRGGVQVEFRGLADARWASELDVGPQWRTVEIPFSRLEGLPPWRSEGPGPKWSGNDVLQLGVFAGGEPGSKVWFELDNIRFY